MATLAVLSGSMAVFLVDLLRLDGSKNVLLNRFVETMDSWDPWNSWDPTLGALVGAPWIPSNPWRPFGPLGTHWAP